MTAVVGVHVGPGDVVSAHTPGDPVRPHRHLPGLQRSVGPPAAVRAQRAALRGAAQRGVRRSHRAGPDRLPEDDGHGPRRGGRLRGVPQARRRRGGLPGPLPPRRASRGGQPDQTGAGRDRTRREGAGDLHDELRQALHPDGRGALPGVREDASGSTARGWWTPTTSSVGTRSTGTPKCRRTPPATVACGCRSPTPPAIYGWVQLGTPVDVYDQGGGGSTTLRGNAGP